jgi:hypothetical protein
MGTAESTPIVWERPLDSKIIPAQLGLMRPAPWCYNWLGPSIQLLDHTSRVLIVSAAWDHAIACAGRSRDLPER